MLEADAAPKALVLPPGAAPELLDDGSAPPSTPEVPAPASAAVAEPAAEEGPGADALEAASRLDAGVVVDVVPAAPDVAMPLADDDGVTAAELPWLAAGPLTEVPGAALDEAPGSVPASRSPPGLGLHPTRASSPHRTAIRHATFVIATSPPPRLIARQS